MTIDWADAFQIYRAILSCFPHTVLSLIGRARDGQALINNAGSAPTGHGKHSEGLQKRQDRASNRVFRQERAPSKTSRLVRASSKVSS